MNEYIPPGAALWGRVKWPNTKDASERSLHLQMGLLMLCFHEVLPSVWTNCRAGYVPSAFWASVFVGDPCKLGPITQLLHVWRSDWSIWETLLSWLLPADALGNPPSIPSAWTSTSWLRGAMELSSAIGCGEATKWRLGEKNGTWSSWALLQKGDFRKRFSVQEGIIAIMLVGFCL